MKVQQVKEVEDQVYGILSHIDIQVMKVFKVRK